MLQLKILQATAKTRYRQTKRETEPSLKKKSLISQPTQKYGDKELQDLVQLLNNAFQASSSGPTVLRMCAFIFLLFAS